MGYGPYTDTCTLDMRAHNANVAGPSHRFILLYDFFFKLQLSHCLGWFYYTLSCDWWLKNQLSCSINMINPWYIIMSNYDIPYYIMYSLWCPLEFHIAGCNTCWGYCWRKMKMQLYRYLCQRMICVWINHIFYPLTNWSEWECIDRAVDIQ